MVALMSEYGQKKISDRAISIKFIHSENKQLIFRKQVEQLQKKIDYIKIDID